MFLFQTSAWHISKPKMPHSTHPTCLISLIITPRMQPLVMLGYMYFMQVAVTLLSATECCAVHNTSSDTH